MKSVISLALLGSVAVANAFPVVFLGTGAGQGISVNFLGDHKNVFAGKLRFKDSSTNETFQTVCADLANTIHSGQAYNVNPSSSSGAAAKIKAAGNIVAANFTSANSNEDATALQVAVWEAVYDFNGSSSPAFGGGNFATSASASILAKAAQYYASVSVQGNASYLKANPTNSGQSQLTAVPEPAALAGLAVAGVMLLVRRKK